VVEVEVGLSRVVLKLGRRFDVFSLHA
jgi:hypothetical protein